MQIKQISVSGLFGIFDHVIPLNMDERITIIHGPNGFGKTAILRILNSFFNSRYSELRAIPFREFRVEFDDSSSVEIIKNADNSENLEKSNIVFNFYKPDSDTASFSLKRVKFAYSYKEINFSKEKGFVFTTRYKSPLSDSKFLSPTDLSSGEQHELVLLYELLFKVQPNSLVLIDEPELSLHVGWQIQFLKDLQEITKLTDLYVLMATHSPDIIQNRWDLTVELKGPEK
ncbi:MAG: hypothetical protein C6Y22_27565 [Hapalosiphonaceae cyanobacterium JJU2]|nr:MAG: hypothetical protein C6Y22_27565 [Hapalosiphonaceae cyanobacterium JJU2]